MGTIWTVATSRGGAGKTVTTALLAANLAKSGYRILVIDADPNRTFSTLIQSGYRGPKFGLVAEARHEEIVDIAQDSAEKADIVLVDTAGFGNQTANFAMAVSDLVLVPTMPDRGGVVEAAKTIKLVGNFARAGRRPIPAWVVLTRWSQGRVAPRETRHDLIELGLPVLKRYIPALARFDSMFFDGGIPTTGPAAFEIGRLVDELASLGLVPALTEETRA